MLHDKSLDSFCKSGFFAMAIYRDMGKMWKLTLHTLYYKTMFFVEQGNHTHQYMLEPIPLSAIRTIGSMWLSSHALPCEIGHWGTSDESGRLCILCPKQVREYEFHNLIQCFASNHIRLGFQHIFNQTQYLHNFSHNHNVHSRLLHSLVKFLNIKSHYSLSHVSREV